MAKQRWIIERDYEELKQELGLGHFEGRNWRGFHHHATLCIAAYGFLLAERNRFPPSARAGYLGFAAHAPSSIIRIRSRRCASFWRACCCGNCLTVLSADRLRAEHPCRNRFRQCRFAVASVPPERHAPARNSTSLSFSTARQRQTLPLLAPPAPAVALPSNLIDQRMVPAHLPAQHVRTNRTGLVVIHCRHWRFRAAAPRRNA